MNCTPGDKDKSNSSPTLSIKDVSPTGVVESSRESTSVLSSNHDDDEGISDVVAFSLCSLCAIRLNYLYPEEYHKSFTTNTIKRMVEHFKLPAKVGNSMQAFVTDDEFTFLSSIKRNNNNQDKTTTFRLIEELILLSISSGSYDARMHYLIVDVAELLGIPRDLVETHCESIYDHLLKAQNDEPTSDDEKYREKRDTRKKIKKYLVIGLASLGGGAVIGVTGGLAAPIVASAFGAAVGAGSVVMSTAAAGVVGSLFGVAGAGLTASKMNKRIGDLEEFSFESLSPENDQTSLTITIAISGWITEESEQQFTRPWRRLSHTREQYCLRYESKYLLELSQAMDYLLSFVVSYAAQEALKYTFLAGVMAAIAWPTALISMANIIDNPWDVCIGRSAEAGKHLADVLMSRQQGKRPVSLVGFSLGARVIFFCLQELAQRKAHNEGIICDVVLLGAPVTASADQWKPLGRVISGRILNGYSSSDWLLKFLYRTSSAAIRVAGLQELCWRDKRVKNIDLTQLVTGHSDYYKKLTEILQFVNIKTLPKLDDDDEVAAAPAPSTVDLSASASASIAAISLAAAQLPVSKGEAREELNENENATTTTTTTQVPINIEKALATNSLIGHKHQNGAIAASSTSSTLSSSPPTTLDADSGIERTISDSTNISTSLSQHSFETRQRDQLNDRCSAANNQAANNLAATQEKQQEEEEREGRAQER